MLEKIGVFVVGLVLTLFAALKTTTLSHGQQIKKETLAQVEKLIPQEGVSIIKLGEYQLVATIKKVQTEKKEATNE